MNRTFRRLVAGMTLAGVVACVACEPPPPPAPLRAQTPGTIHVEGDSTTFDAQYAGGDQSWATSWNVTIGATADACPGIFTGCRPATVALPEAVAAGEVDTLVWALGWNDLGHAEGWTFRDELVWTDLLANKTPASTCIVLVLPGGIDPYDGARQPAEVAEFRTWAVGFAADHPNVVLADYQAVVDADPSLVGPDRVHLAHTPHAASTRMSFMQEGVARCEVTP